VPLHLLSLVAVLGGSDLLRCCLHTHFTLFWPMQILCDLNGIYLEVV
jgi:hypothetical protein